jgi:hypothetical protein
MDIVAMRVFIYSLLPVITAARPRWTRQEHSKSRTNTRNVPVVSLLASVWQAVELVDFSVTSSFRIRSANPSAGRSAIPSNLRSALPIWHSVFLESSPWAGEMASGRPPSSL